MKQNFENLPLSLSERHQNLESCKFLNSNLVASEQKGNMV